MRCIIATYLHKSCRSGCRRKEDYNIHLLSTINIDMNKVFRRTFGTIYDVTRERIKSWKIYIVGCVKCTLSRELQIKRALCLDLWPRVLSYYSDLTLSQFFQLMVAQLSNKAALPFAKILATASCGSSKTGTRFSFQFLVHLLGPWKCPVVDAKHSWFNIHSLSMFFLEMSYFERTFFVDD